MTTPALTPAQMIVRMGTGCNIGNVFERKDHDMSAASVSPVLKAYADKGFKHVRIPCTWYPDELNGACRLDDPVFMKNLDSAIYYAVSLGMCVLLNTHFENWIHKHYDGTEAYKGKFWTLWKNIATRYKGIKQSDLVYEVLNEPNTLLGSFDCNNCNDPTAIGLTRSIIKVGFDGIRSVDPTRIVMLPTNGMQAVCQCAAVYPTASLLPGGGSDKYLMVSVHIYCPWTFCSESGTNDIYLKQSDPFGAMQRDVDNILGQLKTWQTNVGGDSVLGLAVTEFGVGDSQNSSRRNTDIVRSYYRMIAKGCRDRKIAPCVWSDGSKSSWFGLLETLPPASPVTFCYGLADAALGYS